MVLGGDGGLRCPSAEDGARAFLDLDRQKPGTQEPTAPSFSSTSGVADIVGAFQAPRN